MPNQATILVVDDEPKNHDIMSGVLDADYALVHANDGAAALAAIEASTPDLILLDIMMPGIDGYEVCKLVKEHDTARDVPVIFVSAKESTQERLKGYEAGAVDYFVKPFDHDELRAKVHKILENFSAQKSLTSRVAEATNVAFQAMSNTSELGSIIAFMEASYGLSDIPELCTQMLATSSGFGLSCSVRIHGLDSSYVTSDKGSVSPLESSVLEHLETKGRIFDFQNRTAINFPHITLLIKNMPVGDPQRYGVIKDNICFLISGANARLAAIKHDQELALQKKLLMELIQRTNKVLCQLNDGHAQLRSASYNIVEDMSQRLSDVIPRLGLEEYQENSIFKIAEACVTRTRELYDQSSLVDQQFTALMQQLAEIDDGNELSAQQLMALLQQVR